MSDKNVPPNENTDNGIYTYETKCRRCGKLEEWYFAEFAAMPWIKFAEAMQDHITNPRAYPCKECEKETVQDIVSYTSFDRQIK